MCTLFMSFSSLVEILKGYLLGMVDVDMLTDFHRISSTFVFLSLSSYVGLCKPNFHWHGRVIFVVISM